MLLNIMTTFYCIFDDWLICSIFEYLIGAERYNARLNWFWEIVWSPSGSTVSPVSAVGNQGSFYQQGNTLTLFYQSRSCWRAAAYLQALAILAVGQYHEIQSQSRDVSRRRSRQYSPSERHCTVFCAFIFPVLRPRVSTSVLSHDEFSTCRLQYWVYEVSGSALDLVDPVIKATAKKIDRRDSTYSTYRYGTIN